MFSLITQLAILASFCALLLPRSLPAQAKPLPSVKPQVTEATVNPSKSAEIYKQAKEELSDEALRLLALGRRATACGGTIRLLCGREKSTTLASPGESRIPNFNEVS